MSTSVTSRGSADALLVFMAFGYFITGMGAFVVIGIVSPIADGLGVSTANVGFVLTTYAFAYAVLSPIAAAITGTAARRTVLVAALAIFLLGTVASALSTSLTMLAAARVIVALGAAMYNPVAAGVAVAVSPPERRGKALATVFSGGTMAQVVGTPFGAWVSYHFGWAGAFWAVSVLAILGIAIILVTVPRDVRFDASGVDAILGVMKDGRTMFAVAFTATLVASCYVVFTFLGPLIEASVGANPEIRTLYLVLYGFGAVAGNYVGGFATDRVGGRRTLIIICIAQAVLMPIFSITPFQELPFGILVVIWSIFSWSLVVPQQARLSLIAPQAISLVLALNAAMIYVGIAIGSTIGSHVLDWWGLAGLGVSGGLLALLALAHLLVSGRPRAGNRSQRAI